MNKILASFMLLALCFLFLVLGSLLAYTNTFPYPDLQAAFSAAKALFVQKTEFDVDYHEDLWLPSRFKEKGVRLSNEALSAPGLTLYSSINESAAYLIDKKGKVVHRWSIAFSDIWSNATHLLRVRPDDKIFFRRVIAFANGDLLAVLEAQGDSPQGYGLVKLDRNSKVIWKYASRIHHDIQIGENGKIYALSHQLLETPMAGVNDDLDLTRYMIEILPPYIEDYVEVISAEGKLLKKVSVTPALVKGGYSGLLHGDHRGATRDQNVVHINTVHPVNSQVASTADFLQSGQVLLSARDLHVLLVLDLQSEEVVKAITGGWRKQHDPEFLPNGRILMFDNWGGHQKYGRTRVIEIDPLTSAVLWRYEGHPDNKLFSAVRGSQQRLANGNTLITESEASRLLEVTREGEIVWEYINPVRGGENEKYTPWIVSAQRYAPGFFSFLNPN